MSRSTAKADLIGAANQQFKKMWELIDSMTDGERSAVFSFGDSLNKNAFSDEREILGEASVHTL